MSSITIDLNDQVMDWLTKRSLTEKCTVEDFATVIITAVSINSQLNQFTNETQKVHETSHEDA